MAVDWPLTDKQAAVNQFMSAVTRCLFSPARTAPISHCASGASESHAPAAPVQSMRVPRTRRVRLMKLEVIVARLQVQLTG